MHQKLTFIEWLHKPLDVLQSRRDKWILILTAGIFAILFLNLYNPFNVSTWHSGDSFPLFVALSSYGIIGIIILFISQFVLRPLVGLKKFKVRSFVLWFLCEILILGFVMFIIYGDKNLSGNRLMVEFLQSLKYTFLVIALPYGAVLYYLYTMRQKQRLYSIDKSEQRIIKILDENQNVRIAIEPEKLFFIKNADNYVEIYYSKNGNLAKELVRTSLKRLEQELLRFRIIRCHRSYMVNINNISFTKKSKQGLHLELKDLKSPLIPVSKSYVSAVMNEL